MPTFRALLAALLFCAAAAPAPAVTPHVEVRFLPCPLKQHQIAADWWSCTASPSLPVYVYGPYETRVPIFFAHVYLWVPRDIDAPSVVWKDPHGLVSFSSSDQFNGPAEAVAAPGYQILTPATDARGHARSGRTTLVATLTGSVKSTFRFPAIVYQTLRLGCYSFAEGDGASFDANDIHAIKSTPQESDLYVTGPAANSPGGNPGPGYGCLAPFADTSGDYVLHFPGGGVMLKEPRFDLVRPNQWGGTQTSISLQDIKNNVLLFKTRRGSIAKVLVLEVALGRIGGVFETVDSHGVFRY